MPSRISSFDSVLKHVLFILFHQVVQLDGIPDGVGNEVADDLLLKYGTEVEIPGVPGTPVIVEGEIKDPLKKNKFDISFVGIDGDEVTSNVKVARKIWFAGFTGH